MSPFHINKMKLAMLAVLYTHVYIADQVKLEVIMPHRYSADALQPKTKKHTDFSYTPVLTKMRLHLGGKRFFFKINSPCLFIIYLLYSFIYLFI